jgi:pre-mRNA-processing factor SLU7
VEYDRAGRVIKGVEAKARSRYEEDVLLNNHTTVWGSYWADGTWGFACCHSTIKGSYCTGAAGEAAAAANAAQMAANMERRAGDAAAELKRREASKLNDGRGAGAALWGTEGSDAPLDEAKLKEALRRQEAREAALAAGASGASGGGGADERKRRYNSLAADAEAEVTAEDMEAYRLKRGRAEDPMAAGGAKGVGGYDFLE